MSDVKNGVPRISSIDVMRGLVIMLMMLDHVRERFYMHVRTGDPINDAIEPDLFFTRILTHFCAPIFIFLAGMGAWLYAHPTESTYRSPSGFLLKRGFVIILIEIVFYYLVWADSFPNFLFLQVLWAIGLCLIALSVVSRLNYWFIGALGFVIVAGHNFLEPLQFEPGDWAYIPWTILHDYGSLGKIGPLNISLSYPMLPWFGVILLGYFAGPLFARGFEAAKRQRILTVTGIVCLAALLVLRGFNIYGETLPWSAQETAIETLMAFINFTKYPPSLDYILLTLGFGLICLAWFDKVQKPNVVLEALRYFGSAPMFIYVVHLYVLLAAYWILFLAFGATHGERFGLDSVGWIWLGTVLLIVLHYPLAKSFSAFKHREKRNKPWLSYF